MGGIIEAQQALEAEDQWIAREHEEAIHFVATVEAKNKAEEAKRMRLEAKEEERRNAEKAEEERITEIGRRMDVEKKKHEEIEKRRKEKEEAKNEEKEK